MWPALAEGDTFGLGETTGVPSLYSVTVVPEPASSALALAAMIAICGRALRRPR